MNDEYELLRLELEATRNNLLALDCLNGVQRLKISECIQQQLCDLAASYGFIAQNEPTGKAPYAPAPECKVIGRVHKERAICFAAGQYRLLNRKTKEECIAHKAWQAEAFKADLEHIPGDVA